MDMEKILYFDLETTGLIPQIHSIIQIAGIIEIDGEEVERFDIKMKPHPKLKIDQQALISNNTTEEIINANPYTQEEGFREFKRILDKHIEKYNKADKMYTGGYNTAGFDLPFLSRWFEIHRDKYFGSYFLPGSFDGMVLASQYLRGIRRSKMPAFTLMHVAKELGIEVEEGKLHDGLYDIVISKKVIDIVTFKELEDIL